jgi:hypothetical protein
MVAGVMPSLELRRTKQAEEGLAPPTGGAFLEEFVGDNYEWD